jgi:predicted Zn-dependent protease
MSGILYRLGKIAGPSVRKAKWIWQTATNSEVESIKAEYEVGRDLACDVRHRFGLDPDPQTAEVLNEVGARLASCVANTRRSFSFESIKCPIPEAFCLPGGFIYVSRSLVEFCRWDKDEIAFILGHEMAHVIRGHVMERMVSNSAIAAASRVTPVRDVFTASLRKVGIKFLESAYSQDQERQADRLGIRLATAAGYDPHGAIRFLSQIAKSEDKSKLGNYFSSHPQGHIRIDNIRRYVKQ